MPHSPHVLSAPHSHVLNKHLKRGFNSSRSGRIVLSPQQLSPPSCGRRVPQGSQERGWSFHTYSQNPGRSTGPHSPQPSPAQLMPCVQT